MSADCVLPQGSIQRQAGEIKETQVLWRHQLAELITAGRQKEHLHVNMAAGVGDMTKMYSSIERNQVLSGQSSIV